MPANSQPTLRYVVQQHFREADYWHYDLMFECGDGLVTFSLGEPPDDEAKLPCLVRQLPNHRLAYLEHEGEIAGGQGSCKIHDRGTVQWVAPVMDGTSDATPGKIFGDVYDEIVVRLDGEKMRGVYRLARETKAGADHWRMRKDSAK
jgi:hypothetical protein